MKKFGVEIKVQMIFVFQSLVFFQFARSPAQPDKVSVIGAAEKVDECIDELLNLEEEYLQELADRDEDDRYIPPTSRKGATPKNKPQKNSKVFATFCFIVFASPDLILAA